MTEKETERLINLLAAMVVEELKSSKEHKK